MVHHSVSCTAPSHQEPCAPGAPPPRPPFPAVAALPLQKSDLFIYDQEINGTVYTMDWFAFGISLALTVLLCLGVKESATVNNIITVAHIGVMLFIIIAGFTQGSADK